MPKIVDPEARRRAVADATFRVIARVGLQHASLRAIADEAGLAIGSVRHYFAGHAELTVFALKTLLDRLSARLYQHIGRFESLDQSTRDATVRDVADEIFAEFLPADQTRREEAAVWLAFVTAARTTPDLQPHAQQLFAGMRTVVSRVLTRMQQAGHIGPACDIPLETERLCALLDGLTLNGLLQPDRLSPGRMREVLAGHLDELSSRR